MKCVIRIITISTRTAGIRYFELSSLVVWNDKFTQNPGKLLSLEKSAQQLQEHNVISNVYQ